MTRPHPLRVRAVSAEPCEQVTRNRKKPVASRSPQVPQWCRIRVAPATVSGGWLWEMRSAIMTRERDRNPMEIADGLGHGFWRLLPLWTIRKLSRMAQLEMPG